jgi:glycosyltransferase involved in cell wall biosynthesis
MHTNRQTGIPTCTLVVPAYNEEKGITECLDRLAAITREIKTHHMEIIVVNDGSTDRTPELLAARNDVTIVHHERNRGYGAALHTGLRNSRAEWFAMVDSDGTYPIDQLKVLLEQSTKGFDMVVGARRGIGIERSPHRRIARWILRRIVWGLTGVMVPDLNSGMRVFRRDLFDEFQHLLPFGFSFTTTITVASLYCGYRVSYQDIQYNARFGKSHIRPLQDFLGFTMLIVRLASYFDPLRFFLPISFLLLFSGILRGIRDVVLFNSFGGVSVIFLVSSLQVFLTGIIADVLVRRTRGGSLATVSLRDRRQSIEIVKGE